MTITVKLQFDQLQQLIDKGGQIVAAIDDLKNAVTALNTSISNEIAAVAAKIAELGGGITAAQAADIVAQLTTAKTTLDNETASLTGSGGGGTP